MNNEWEYYNHALVPTTAPHVEPDVSWIRNKKVWKEFAGGKYPLLVRWVTDFDCGQETEWWHCIKMNRLISPIFRQKKDTKSVKD